MPAVPPINPQLLMALAQKFGGIAPAINAGGWPGGTPPFLAAPRVVLPRTNTRDADAQGRIPPQRPMVIPTGSAAPTAPGTTPSPSSLGGALSRIPAAAPATLGGQDDFGQPVQAPTPPVGKLGTLPEGAEQIYAPDLTPPGGKVFNKDGTTYVVDKDGTVVRRMEAQPHDPNAPAGGAQTPASMPQKKGGIWSRLTDPSLAGIALAAGQQMTRARYPGESGIGNAVNAVTAGYNQLAQQRAMQVAREEAKRKADLEEREQKRKEQDTISQAAERKAQAERFGKQSEHEATADKLAQVKFDQEKLDKKWEQQHKYYELAIQEKRDIDAARHQKEMERLDGERVGLQRETNNLARIKFGQDVYEFGQKRIDEKEFNKRKLEYERIRSEAAATQARASMIRAGNTTDTKNISQATRIVMSGLNRRANDARMRNVPWIEPDEDATQEEIIRTAGAITRGEVKPEEPPVLGPDDYGPPRFNLGPAVAPGQVTEGKDPKTGHAIVLGPNNQWLDKRTGKPIPQ